MQSGIQAKFTWNRSHIFASKTNKAVLLIEWSGGTFRQPRRRTSPKLIARDIQLHLWLEPHVSILKSYGTKPMPSDQHSFILYLGDLYEGVKQALAFEFAFEPLGAGMQSVLSAQWRYKEKNKERVKEMPVKELYMDYTYHLGLLQEPEDVYVIKHMKLLQSPELLRKAVAFFEHGDAERGEWMLRRLGDDLLLSAARFGDGRLADEAARLYQLCDYYVSTYSQRLYQTKNG